MDASFHHRPNVASSRGFTLIELLVVMAIISIVAAIIFPAFAAARGKARQTTCMSNLRQIGVAIQMYSSDYNELFPLGGDPEDLNTNVWQTGYNGQFWAVARKMSSLWQVLIPYTTSHQIWHCPSDNGITSDDTLGMGLLPLTNNSFDAYGSSYYYHTELALRQLSIDTATSYAGSRSDSVSYIPLLFDGNGIWHGGEIPQFQRYDVLFCDGHVQSLSAADLIARFNESLVPRP